MLPLSGGMIAITPPSVPGRAARSASLRKPVGAATVGTSGALAKGSGGTTTGLELPCSPEGGTVSAGVGVPVLFSGS